MATIKITRGGCGIRYTDAHGGARHALKTPESGAFECDDAQAARLVGLGVAVYISAPAEAPVQDEPTGKTGKLALDPAELEALTVAQLQALAGDIGVDVGGCKKKADYVAALVAAEVECELDGEDDDDLPELSAADPE